MIEALARRLDASALGAPWQRLVAALERAGLEPSLLAGALRLLALGRVRPVGPRALLRLLGDRARHGGFGAQALLRLHAFDRPSDLAVVAPGTPPLRLTWAELDQRIVRLAWGLGELGVGPGQRVALLLENGVEQIEVSAALGWLGAHAVPIGYRLKPREIGFLLADAGARALVFHGAYRPVVEAALIEAAAAGVTLERRACVQAGDGAGDDSGEPAPGFTDYRALLAGAAHPGPPAVQGGGFGGLIVYTSGTTGRPKGAARDYRSMGLGPILNFVADLPIGADERHLVVCPQYHSAGAFFSQLVLGLGGTLILHRHFDPQAVLATIERERVTSVALVPTMLGRLLGLGRAALAAGDLSSLRWLMSVAAPLPTELARAAEEALGPVLYNFYAATETGVVTLARPGEHTARPGTIGRAVLGNRIRLLDPAGQPVPVGAVGELYVHNSMLVGGYHNRPADFAAASQGGYFSVGDLARVDDDGYYYLADRKADLVISGGVNIYPLEIEQRLHAHPAVADCAVVGAPDAEWGESLCAFVVLRPGSAASAAELQRFVTEDLADYKRPRQVRFVAELPRNPTGKVDKRALRALLVDKAG